MLSAVVYGAIWLATNPPYGTLKDGLLWKKITHDQFIATRLPKVSKHRLSRALGELHKAGLIFIAQRIDSTGRGNPNWYAINPDIPEAFAQGSADKTYLDLNLELVRRNPVE